MPADLFDEVPQRALAIYAHPDDADVACGGTLARWAAAESAVELVVCAHGEKGTSNAREDPLALAGRRAKEVDASAALIGLQRVYRLGRLDGEFENDLELRGALVEIIRTAKPEVIVCPDPLAVFFGAHYYNHRDHRVVGFAALDAASPAASSPLYFPGAGAAHTIEYALLTGSLDANVYVDVSGTIESKVEAVLCHTSQLGAAPDAYRPIVEERAAEAGHAAGVEYAEAFRRVWLNR